MSTPELVAGVIAFLVLNVVVALVMRAVAGRKLRAAERRLVPPLDDATRAGVRQAIEHAGGADRLIRSALREASEGIERAHRSGAALGTVSMAVPALARVRRAYARTGDDELDAFRALTLAREAEATASRQEARNAPFDEWLRDHGHRLLR